MIFWVDAQLSPALAPWLAGRFGVEAYSVRHLRLRSARDRDIFDAARAANAVVITKDADFALLQKRHGAPPAVVWVRCGNTSNAHLKNVLLQTFQQARELIDAGEILVEITDLA